MGRTALAKKHDTSHGFRRARQQGAIPRPEEAQADRSRDPRSTTAWTGHPAHRPPPTTRRLRTAADKWPKLSDKEREVAVVAPHDQTSRTGIDRGDGFAGA